MQVVALNGSPRRNGNTAIILQKVMAVLEEEGIDTQLMEVADYPMEGCRACGSCLKSRMGGCVISGDGFMTCFSAMAKADGILLGSPVYASDVTAQMKAFIDRASMVLAANRGLFRHKVGAAVTAVRRGGGTAAFDTMTRFLHSKEMFLVGSTYWNMVYGREVGEVEHDREGMENMENLGRNMAWLLKRIGKEVSVSGR